MLRNVSVDCNFHSHSLKIVKIKKIIAEIFAQFNNYYYLCIRNKKESLTLKNKNYENNRVHNNLSERI